MSASAGFHAVPLPWSNWNLEMTVFTGELGNPEKKPMEKGDKQKQTQPIYGTDQHQTLATLVGGVCSHHCNIAASCCRKCLCLKRAFATLHSAE